MIRSSCSTIFLKFGGQVPMKRVLVGKPEGKIHLGDPGIDGRIILR